MRIIRCDSKAFTECHEVVCGEQVNCQPNGQNDDHNRHAVDDQQLPQKFGMRSVDSMAVLQPDTSVRDKVARVTHEVEHGRENSGIYHNPKRQRGIFANTAEA